MFKPAIKMRVEKLSSEYYSTVFKLIEPLHKTPEPLQFVNIWVPGVDEVPMSVSDYDEVEESLSIIYRVVGEGTRHIRDRDGFFGVKGPIGRGFDPARFDNILFIGGGVGISPLPYLAKVASNHDVHLDVVWGVRTANMLFDIRKLAVGVREIYYATEDCTFGYCGTVVDLLGRVISSRGGFDAYVAVGPRRMLREICRLLSSSQDVYVSLESYVKCGVGACGSCVLKPIPRLLCIHGPVFNCKEVERYLEQDQD